MRQVLLFVSLFIVSFAIADNVTIVRSAPAMADQYGWVHDTKPGVVSFNNVISLTNEKPNDQCKYDANNKGIRFYQQCGWYKIQAAQGAVIKSIKLTYISTGNSYGVVTTDFGADGYSIPSSNQIQSGQTYAINAQSVQMWTGSTSAKATDGGTGNRGQVRITAFEIVYYDSLSVLETYSSLQSEGVLGSVVSFEGDKGLYSWQVKNFQHKASDNGDYVNGLFGIRLKYNGTSSEGYLKMNGNQEGGVKAISFDYHTTGNEMPIHLLVKGDKDTLDDFYRAAPASTSYVLNYSKELNLKHNTSIQVINPKKETPQQTFVVMSPMIITPYLLFNLPNRRDAISIKGSGTYDLKKVLINNTGEEPLFQVTNNTTGATVVITDGVLAISDMEQQGEIGIMALWNDSAVTTTMTLLVDFVPEPQVGDLFTETFSNCVDTQVFDSRIHVAGDQGIYDWSIARFQRVTNEDSVAGVQGIRLRYNGSIAMVGEQEGGIKQVEFDWRTAGSGYPVHFVVRADEKDYSFQQAAMASVARGRYIQPLQIKHNTNLMIMVPGEESPAQSYIIVGPVSIMPYLLFTKPNHIDTIVVADTTQYDLSKSLIDNTEASEEVVYTIVADATGAATISGSVVDVSQVQQSGKVDVQASWHDVTTTLSLFVQAEDPSGLDRLTDSPVRRFTKVIQDGQLRIYRDGKGYSVLGNTIQ